jgi:hypothetical protein
MYSTETLFEIFVVFYMIFGIILVLLFDPDAGCIDIAPLKFKVRKIMRIFPIKEKKEPEISDSIA